MKHPRAPPGELAVGVLGRMVSARSDSFKRTRVDRRLAATVEAVEIAAIMVGWNGRFQEVD